MREMKEMLKLTQLQKKTLKTGHDRHSMYLYARNHRQTDHTESSEEQQKVAASTRGTST